MVFPAKKDRLGATVLRDEFQFAKERLNVALDHFTRGGTRVKAQYSHLCAQNGTCTYNDSTGAPTFPEAGIHAVPLETNRNGTPADESLMVGALTGASVATARRVAGAG